jgi:hypothetical protein
MGITSGIFKTQNQETSQDNFRTYLRSQNWKPVANAALTNF